VIYTGTHDNDTTRGWWKGLEDNMRKEVLAYLGQSTADIPWALIHLAWASVAQLAVCPLQDLLSLGSEARMNHPGRPDANWDWRYLPGALNTELQQRLGDMTRRFGRAKLET
jgi:4-alpha-glucanotransferase